MVEGSIQSLAVPGTQATIAGAAPQGRATAAQGLAGSFQLLAVVPSFASPALDGSLGASTVFVLAGAAMALAGLGVAVLHHRTVVPTRETVTVG